MRALHAALLRRAETAKAAGQDMPRVPENDPLEDATVILAGRGRSYPHLSVGLGQQTGLIGVLTIEVAARYLKSRDADGLVIGDGFDPRNVEAMLTVMAEDTRFRDLPVGVLGRRLTIDTKRLPHIVFASDAPGLIARVLPLIRLHAFEGRLRRALHAFDKAGIVDPSTGLLCQPAFLSELTRVMRDAGAHGTGLSVARFAFDPRFDQRARNDAARLVSKLVRGADFACRDQDGSILVAFAETDPKHAQVVARSASPACCKHTMLHPERGRAPAAPRVTLTGRKSADTVSLAARADHRRPRLRRNSFTAYMAGAGEIQNARSQFEQAICRTRSASTSSPTSCARGASSARSGSNRRSRWRRIFRSRCIIIPIS